MSPRSQSVPPNFPGKSALTSQHNAFYCERIRIGTPSSIQVPHSPMKAKFKEKIQQKEALVALKTFGNALGKPSRITHQMKDITVNKHLAKSRNKISRKSNKEKLTDVNEKNTKNTTARTKFICEKRKSEMNATDKLYQKKIKYDNIENCLHSSKLTFDATSEDKNLNQPRLDNTTGDGPAIASILSDADFDSNIDEGRKINTCLSTTIKSIKEDLTGKDKSKAQRSILQYFTVE